MKKSIFILIAIIAFSCSNHKQNNNSERLIALQTEIDSLKKLEVRASNSTKGQITTFLTFQKNNAEEAMNFYVGLFENSKVINVQRWGKGGPVEEGRIMHATFQLNGKLFMCSDSPPIHDWGFTPAVSNYIEFENESELERLFSILSENGKIMMPIDNYGFSQKFGFIEDQFGVSWQLNLN